MPSVQQALIELQERTGKMLGSQQTFLSAPEEQEIIAGGFGCVAPETLISGIPIAERFHQNVQTLFGPVRPSDPFLKGHADLYEVVTRSGKRVVVTLDHRFLSQTGWARLRDLRAGDFLAASGTSHELSDLGRELSSRGYCSSDLRPNGVSRSPVELVLQDKWQQLRRNYVDGNASLVSILRSKKHFSRLLHHEVGAQFLALATDAGLLHEVWEILASDNFEQFLYRFPRIDISKQFHRREDHIYFDPDDLDATQSPRLSKGCASYLGRSQDALRVEEPHPIADKAVLVSSEYYNTFWDQIVNIRFVRHGQFYDLHVPFLEHYDSAGLISHNSGKTHIMCTKGLVLSSIFPGNRGLIGRYHSTDLEDSTIPVFFDVCPPSWIRSYNKQSKRVVLKNGSEILFRHLHDAKAQTKSRRVGANLGWAAIDQLEECEIGHWNTMLGRLRLPAAKKKFLLGTMNPAGHDDFYKLFFQGINEDLKSLPKDLFHTIRRHENRLGIMVNSNENRTSNGGFVDDGYFDKMIESYPREWVERYIYCSFDDFAGKIYREYKMDSVHNIDPFPVPSHWNAIIGIDVGGDAPWAISDQRIDEFGNLIQVNEFYKPSVNVAEVAGWIKRNTPWNAPTTTFVIDWENKLAMLELSEHGIHCQPAMKAVHAGILRTGGYYHINPKMGLPSWYKSTQAVAAYERFKDKGSPKTFIFKTLKNGRNELDNYVWENNKPRKKNDHYCDSDRYVKVECPEASKLPAHDKFQELRAIDPGSAREWEAFDRRNQARLDKQHGKGIMKEFDLDYLEGSGSDTQEAKFVGKFEMEG